MLSVTHDWNPLQKNLKDSIKNRGLTQIIETALTPHGLVHSGNTIPTVDLDESMFRVVRSPQYQGYCTLAFYLFHITRIEDMCANILIDHGTQVIMQGDWMQKMRIVRIESGNSRHGGL
ncbi:hypothetical protein [Musicola keenii]|uniref:hypothetical protein n=1 Tax=Musicola keenii TaxID=2884250 RepID=UPI00177F6E17|nr:hypothetical protein [Musicola keenii]